MLQVVTEAGIAIVLVVYRSVGSSAKSMALGPITSRKHVNLHETAAAGDPKTG